MVAVLVATSRGRSLVAFVGSSAFITGMLIATAACLFPVLLQATGEPSLSITAHNAGSNPSGLRTALGWWVVGFPIAVLYFVILFCIHRGKARPAAEGESY